MSLGFAGAALTSACGGTSDSTPSGPAVSCAEDHMVAGECVGVLSQPVCDANVCAEGASCAHVIEVHDDATLTSAIGSAHAGDCIALDPGSYGDAPLPSGVSLLGRGADFVKVHRVTLAGTPNGTNVTIRGMAMSGGLELDSTVSVHVDSVRVVNNQGDGVTLKTDASATITRSDIQSSGMYGISAFGSGTVVLDHAFVGHGQNPGLWIQCADLCNCVKKPPLTVTRSAFRDNKIVGISVVAASATLTDVEVTDNTETNFKPGGGVSVSECSTVTATGLNVLDNTSFGILVDNSSATLGASGTDKGLRVERNLMGVWIQNLSAAGNQPVKVENGHFDANVGVGLGTSGASHGIIIYGTEIKNTQKKVLPVLVDGVGAGSKEVGDGLNWLDASGIQIDGLTLSGNARASVLIDGEVAAGSSIANVTLSGGDAQKGILQQNLKAGGVQPQLGSGVPTITVNMGEVFAIPAAPAVPSGI